MNSKKLLMKENKQCNLNSQKNKDYILNELKQSLNSYDGFIKYENGVYFGKDGRKVRKIFKLRQS